MNESHRQHYLDVLGIESYIPRWVLPNAAHSAECEFDVAADVVVDAAAETGANYTGVQSLGDVVSAVVNSTTRQITIGPSAELSKHSAAIKPVEKTAGAGKIIVDDSTKSRQAKLAEAEKNVWPTPELQKVLRFSLSIWRVSDELMVVDSRQLRLALPTDSLLNNILSALGYRFEQPPRAEVLRWPMLDNHQASATDIDDARDMVQAYLAAQAEKRPVKYVLLMGAIAARFALPAQHWPENNDQRALLGKTFEIENRTHIVVPSLAAMLQTPVLKPITWQAIQPLRVDAIGGNSSNVTGDV